MTRKIVYVSTLVAVLAAMAMTISAIILPHWISFETDTSSGTHIRYSYGLHRRCSSITKSCSYFPQYEDCHGPDRYFCSMWRSVGFLMSFAVVIEGMTLIAYIVILAGGKQKRETGWKILVVLLGLGGAILCAAMAIVAYLYDNDDRFFVGWKLDVSWILDTVSWSVLVLSALVVGGAAMLLPSEGGYELIPGGEF